MGLPVIQILGARCARCRTLAARTAAALEALGVDTQVELIDDPWRIADFGVMRIPALVVDGLVVTTGKVPRTKQLCTLIEGAINR